MSINVSQSFHRTSANPVDDTLTLTKAQMLAVNDNLMPNKYMTVCQDDGKIYVYDKTNTSDAQTGKFRKYGEEAMPSEDMPSVMTPLPSYSGGSANPTGTIISFMGVYAPQGYLKCDGTVYNIADYQRLADFFKAQFGSANKFGGDGTTTFATPNLSGEFLRGTGTNGHSGEGSGAAVGTHQNSTRIPSTMYDGGASGEQPYLNFPIGANGTSSRVLGYAYQDALFDNPNGDKRTWWNASSISSKDTYTEKANGMYSARPTSTSVLYCIKD